MILLLIAIVYQHNKIIMLSHELQERALYLYQVKDDLQEMRAQLYQLQSPVMSRTVAKQQGMIPITAERCFFFSYTDS